jgi:hypothetical protein
MHRPRVQVRLKHFIFGEMFDNLHLKLVLVSTFKTFSSIIYATIRIFVMILNEVMTTIT